MFKLHTGEEEKPAKRIPLAIGVAFKRNYARNLAQGTLLNISVSGAFLKIQNQDFQKDEKITLQFKVGSRERKLAAHVVWINEYGAGVQFIHNNNRDVQIIDDLMYYVEESRHDRKEVLKSIFDKVS